MPDDMSQILNNFKNLMNSNQSNRSHEDFEKNDTNNNFNITPEMISNLSEILKNSNMNNSSNNQSTNKSNNSSNTSNSANTNSQIDFETMMKIKSIMEKLNKKDDPRSNLLYSLKPYLRESRQKKIDEYSNLLKIVSMSDIFQNK